MNRREFSKALGLGAMAMAGGRFGKAATTAAPQFSITMDDFNWRNAVYLTAAQRNNAFLKTLAGQNTKAALFVVGRNADDEQGMSLLRLWDEAGHIIGNN